MHLTRTHRHHFPLYVVPSWNGLPIVHGFGTRDVTLEQYVHGEPWRIPITRQVHGGVVHVLDGLAVERVYVGDAFITSAPGVLCCIRTADCLPLLMVDPVRRVVGAVHAGWRGLVAGVIERAIERLVVSYRVVPERLQVAMGPSIGVEEYEVDAPVMTAIRHQGFRIDDVAIPVRCGHWQLNVQAVAMQLLQSQGIDGRHIATTGLSTFGRPGEFHSYRRRPQHTGRQFSFIGLLAAGRR